MYMKICPECKKKSYSAKKRNRSCPYCEKDLTDIKVKTPDYNNKKRKEINKIMKNKKPIRVINLPDFNELKGQKPGETLYNLFKHLIPKDMPRPVDVDPKKIKFNCNDCKQFITSIQKEVGKNKETKIALMWMNQGPGVDKDIPEGKIYLYKGYMQPNQK